MSFEPSSPSSDIPDTDPFDSVAYSDIVEGSIYYEEEMEIGPNTYNNKRSPVPLDAFAQRYISTFNRYPSQEDFRFQNELINEQLITNGLPPRPSSPFVTFQEPNSSLPTSPSLVSKINCAKTPSKRTNVKSPRCSINLGVSKVENLKEHLDMKIKKFQDMRTQKLSPIQAGQLASDLAQDLLDLASFQARLKEEYNYMLELSLSGSK